jgi:hypothetical protein
MLIAHKLVLYSLCLTIPSDTREKVGVQWHSTSAICRFQERL